MTVHPADARAANPRIQCAVCAKWKRLYVAEGKPSEQSPYGYARRQRFFGGCNRTHGDHPAGDVCDDCCFTACTTTRSPTDAPDA